MILFLTLLAAIADPSAQAADAARTDALNAGVRQRIEATDAANRARQDAYARERAAYEQALAENERARAVAAERQRAYLAAEADYRVRLAEWQGQGGATAGRAAPAPAVPAAPTPPAPPGDAKARKVCRTTQAIESRIARNKVCRTAAEWRVIDGQTQGGMRDAARRIDPGN